MKSSCVSVAGGVMKTSDMPLPTAVWPPFLGATMTLKAACLRMKEMPVWATLVPSPA